MATFVAQPQRIPATYYRPPTYVPQPRADVRDDYERWYTETVPNNRMSLSIRSGIDTEVSWALERLCRLAHNDGFLFSSIPGVIDGLFDWPEWYITQGYKEAEDCDLLFSSRPDQSLHRRFALESLFILRNAVLHEQNAQELAAHTHTVALILNGLHNLDHTKDENTEFLIHIIDIFNVVASRWFVQQHIPDRSNPIPPLLRIAEHTTNRTLIISSLTALTALLSNPVNAPHHSADSKALNTAIRYLPLFGDKPLLDACLNQLYCHISQASMAKSFLLHSDMPAVLKLLASLLLQEQAGLEKTMSLDKTGPIYTAPASTLVLKDHELTKEELDDLIGKPEPQRCYDWMRAVFIAKPDGEVTQVDFWNLYKDCFTPYSEQHALLVASDVIKNVTNVFPQAQAMVLQGPTPRFVVRGVDRRKMASPNERFRCHWDRGQCPNEPCSSTTELYEHILEHLNPQEPDASGDFSCLWGACPRTGLPKHELRSHVLTHLSSTQPSQKHPSQSDTITLPSEHYPFPTENPTSRPPPPPRSTTITYPVPLMDPPSTSLTALLILRVLFRTSFASADAAPRVDADHFGFPGIVEDTGEPDGTEFGATADEKEGERRGRKAFMGIRKLLEEVRIRDEALMSWVTEMIDEV